MEEEKPKIKMLPATLHLVAGRFYCQECLQMFKEGEIKVHSTFTDQEEYYHYSCLTEAGG